MYGVPANLDLRLFTGLMLQQACFGQFQTRFYFEFEFSITIEGRWQILDPQEKPLVDIRRNAVLFEPVKFHLLLGQKVIGNAVHAPDWFELKFENGLAIRIFDDSQQYESFSISPGEIIG